MATEIRIQIENVDSDAHRDMIIPDDFTAGDLCDIIVALFDWSFDEPRAMSDSNGEVPRDDFVMAHLSELRFSYKNGLWTASVEILGEKEGEPPMVTGYAWKYITDAIEGPEDFNKLEKDGSDASLPDHYLALKRFAELPRFDIKEFNDWLKSCLRIASSSDPRLRTRGRTRPPDPVSHSSTGTCPRRSPWQPPCRTGP